ncbi:MAG: hypothetical protein ACR2II_03955 [Chthoniobacterales bacterium]
MNYIALLPEAPWLVGIGVAAIVAFLLGLPRLLGIVYIPHTHVGTIEKIWSSKGSLCDGQIIARMEKPVCRPGSRVAGFTSGSIRGNIVFLRNHLLSSVKARWPTSLKKESRSALIVSVSVVGRPCGLVIQCNSS